MRPDERAAVPQDAEGVLEVRAQGEHRRRGAVGADLDRQRAVAARAPDHVLAHRRRRARPSCRSVRRCRGRAGGRRRRWRRDAAQCLVVVLGDRLVADVAAGHHQRARRPGRGEGGAAACRAASRPSSSSPGATAAAIPAAVRRPRRSSTIGRALLVSAAASAAPTIAISARGGRGRAPSPRTACRDGACARATGAPRRRRRRAPPAGSRRAP